MGMTNEEAITIIKNEFSEYADTLSVYAEKRKEAFDMAIKAIEQQPCEDCISREQTLKAFAKKCCGECGCCEYNGSGYDSAENCKLIKSLPSVTPTISKMEQVEDAISRDAVMKCFKKWQPYMATRILGYEQELSQLPSVTPQQTRWIPVSEMLPEKYGEYICTMSNDNVQECGFVPSSEKGLIPGWSTCEADGFKKLDYRDIKAWMPLPEPYKAESEVNTNDT